MMRRFFKKLTFVMALSMVVSSASPAARIVSAADDRTLSIAYQNGATITELNLTEVRSSEDLKAVGAPSNWKELGMTWISSDPSIATVDKAGVVTAVSSGSTEIMVICGDYIGTITVNCFDAAKKYTATIGTADERSITEKTLAVGGEFDFNFYGIKDYGRDSVNNASRYFCEWDSTDTSVATVDKNGIVTAVAPGKAKITLIVWNLATGTKHEVTPCWVTVEADATPTPTPTLVRNELNETQNTVLINVEDKDWKLEDVEFYRVFKADNDNNGDGVIDERDAVEPYQYFYVNTIEYDPDAEALRITTFDDFADGATYEVRINGRTEQFVASVGNVAKVVVYTTQNAVLASENTDAVPANLAVTLYDAKGVNVTTRKVNGVANNDTANIYYDLTTNSDAYNLSDNEVWFYENAKATVIATYNYNGVEVASAPLTISPSVRSEYGVAEIVAWTLVKSSGKVSDWTDLEKTIPAETTGYVVATLLRDTNGKYFTTHEKSATANSGVKYNGNTIYWTEDSEQDFWKNGLYVEYKAMNPDKMLVENYGEIASYEQGNARFALYLYNYNQYNGEFVKELYSQYITVCHPNKLSKMTADTTVTVMKNTETEDKDQINNTYSNKTYTSDDNYYSKFSKKDLNVYLWDIHGGKATSSDAAEANFEIKITSTKSTQDTDWDGLVNLIEGTYANLLNTSSANERKLSIDANEITSYTTRNQVKFRITETTTKTSVNVTINLKDLALTSYTENGQLKYSDVALVQEYMDNLGTNMYFEKFEVASTSIAVDQKIENALSDSATKGTLIYLTQKDKNGNEIGYESKLYVGTTLNATLVGDVVDSTGAPVTSLKKGDRVLTVKDPSGRPYSILGDANGVANTVYNKKVDSEGYGTVATSSAMGVVASGAADAAQSPSGTSTDIAAYQLLFAAKINPSSTGLLSVDSEYVYAKTGRYTLTIRTVEDTYTDKNGNVCIRYASGAGLKTTITVNVTNTNPEVTYASRDLTRIEGASLPYSTAGSGYGSDVDMKQYILNAFNFKLGNSDWAEGQNDYGTKLNTDNILYYTYTVTPSNKQIVINTVTFKVPVYNRDDDGNLVKDASGSYVSGWYRSTATVNKSLTFEY